MTYGEKLQTEIMTKIFEGLLYSALEQRLSCQPPILRGGDFRGDEKIQPEGVDKEPKVKSEMGTS